MIWLLSTALAGDVAEAHQALLLGQEELSEADRQAQELAFLAGWKSLEEGYLDQALATFRAGHGYPAAVGEAATLTRMERFDEAGLALQNLPADDEVLYLQAWVWTHQGEDEAAVALLVQIAPHSPLAEASALLAEAIEELPERRRPRARALADLSRFQLRLTLDGEELVPYVTDPW
ncbi:MAG: hypothetical protein GY913_12125 [Proteobacteria bacterium]|nr:hypothetical protein [Pseudomonadota bacterium]MCP4917663.1 hypothetical protein [Pseudomonadota bacterium]